MLCKVLPEWVAEGDREAADLVLVDDAEVDIGAGAQVIVDPGPDGPRHQLLGILHAHVLLEAVLKHSHGVQRPGAHGAVGQAVCGPMRIHLHSGFIVCQDHRN